MTNKSWIILLRHFMVIYNYEMQAEEDGNPAFVRPIFMVWLETELEEASGTVHDLVKLGLNLEVTA